MTSDDPIKTLIDAAEKMDKWLFQTCRSSRFRRLVSHGLPAQELHDALELVNNLKNQQAINVDCSHMTKAEFNAFIDELRGAQFSIGVEIYRTEDGLTGLMNPGPIIPVDPIKERLNLKDAHEKGFLSTYDYEKNLEKIEREIKGVFGVDEETSFWLKKISPANIDREMAELEEEEDDECFAALGREDDDE